MTPAVIEDASSRVQIGELDHVYPFYAFQLDAGISAKMAANKLGEQRKSLEIIATLEYTTCFGRPLWLGRSQDTPTILRQLVRRKLFGGQHLSLTDPNHIFALLGARLSLDPCLLSKAAVSLDLKAVTSHLRWGLILKHDFRKFDPPGPHCCYTLIS